MPTGTALALGGAGVVSGLLGAGAARSAANTQTQGALEAARIQAAAANRAADMQMGMFNTIRDDLSPYRSVGAAALNPYLQLLGIGGVYGAPAQPSSSPVGRVSPTRDQRIAADVAGGYYQPGSYVDGYGVIGPNSVAQAQAVLSGGSPTMVNNLIGGAPQQDWAGYLQAYPDVGAEYQRQLMLPKGPQSLAEKGITDLNSYAAWHYNTLGKNEGRQVSMLPSATAGTGGTVAPTLTPDQIMANQQASSAAMQAALEATPGYQFTRDQGTKAVTSNLFAKGLGGASGAYGKGLARFVTGLADQTYGENVQRMADAVGVGQSAANQTGAYGQGAAQGAAGSLIGGANAQAGGIAGAANAGAAGTIGAANALGGGINNAAGGLLAGRVLGMYGPQNPSLSSVASSTIANNPLLF